VETVLAEREDFWIQTELEKMELDEIGHVGLGWS
jgi:hypothetical protein